MTSYDFNDRLRMSNGVAVNQQIETVLLREIPGALSVVKSHVTNDKTGVDFWVEHATARHLAVDVKAREVDWSARGQDDLALEIWSVCEKEVIGWTRNENKRCDYVFWIWEDTRRWCLVPFLLLCRVFQDKWQSWSQEYQTAKQYTPNHGGYHSECVFVPRKEIWRAMYSRFSGQPV